MPQVESGWAGEKSRDAQASGLDTRDKIIGNMTEKDVVDFVNDNLKESQERCKPISAIQDMLWMLYRNREDFSDKEDWQSKAALPKAYSTVKQAAANLVKLLLYSDQWVNLEGYGMLEKILAPLGTKALNTLMKSAEFEFVDAFESSLESSLACGIGILKVVPASMSIDPNAFIGGEMTKRRDRKVTLRCQDVDFRRFAWGPYSNQHRLDWCSEDSTVPYAYIKTATNSKGEPRYMNLDKIEKESFEEPPEEVKSWVRFDFAQPWMRSNLRLNLTSMREWYGDIINRDGEIVGYNRKVTIFNRKWLAAIEDNPFPWAPYAVFSPLAVAFRFPGEGVLEASLELFRQATRLANLKIDSQFYTELKQFEVDLNLLENKEDILTGLEPGKMYRKRMGTGSQQAIREIQVSGNKPTSFEMDARLDTEIERGTFYADMPTQADLAAEVQVQNAKQNAILLNMAERIERHGLSQVAEMAWTMMLMFLDSGTHPNWSLLLGAPNQLDKMTAKQRSKLIGTEYTFRFDGISQTVRLMDRAGHIMKILELIKEFPLVQAILDVPRMLRDLMKSIGGSDYVVPDAEQKYQEALQAAEQAKEQQAKQELENMNTQFEMRNEHAMKRDAFKHQLKRDDMYTKAGLEHGAEEPPVQGAVQ